MRTPKTPLNLATSVLAALLASATLANNIQVTNVTLTGTNEVAGTTQVRFNISWENSWRTSSAPNNWDAAWVFVKYRDAATGLWQHARLGSDADHVAPGGSTIATGLLTPGTGYNASTNWGVGVFIHRSANGTGTFLVNNVELRWNYGTNSITFSNIAEIRVFAVEMVYVPEGSFRVGSGGSEYGALFQSPSPLNPYLINSEGPIIVGTSPGNLLYSPVNSNFSGDGIGPIPAEFPKGYVAFYMMKNELSQQHYVDFLNTLTREQQNNRTGSNLSIGVTSVFSRFVMSNTSSPQFRNGIRCDASINPSAPVNFYCDLNGVGIGSDPTDGLWVSCNWLSWGDLAAYLDWSGLRPMTELEFEKACRGPLTPVANELCWGTTSSIPVTSLSGAGSSFETASLGANSSLDNSLTTPTPGPVRVGLFATSGSDRQQSGASYYGVLDLSGNNWERTISIGHPAGRLFQPLTGDGVLSASGGHNVPLWPVTNAVGVGFRGGNWGYTPLYARTSDRTYANTIVDERRNDHGGRGVRSIP